MTRLKLPIGIQTFREIREDACYYADKTAFALRLIEQGKYYFLSRPRRFGKSLFLDTLAELFAGNEALFRGLHVHDRWNWNVRYPVIRISFGGGVVQDIAQLERKIGEQLRINQATLGLTCTEPAIDGCFAELIRAAHAATEQRVVDLLLEREVFPPRLGQLVANEALLSAFDVEHIATEALLFQTGYLTIDSVRRRGALIEYRLRWPNLEVYASLNDALLRRFTPPSASTLIPNPGRLYELLEVNDFTGIETLIGVEFSRKQRALVGFEVESLAAA